MANYAIIRNAMTNATEADLLFFQNEFLYQKGIIDSASLAVTKRGAGANMSVDVAPGRAIILNAAWSLNSSVTKYWEILCDDVQNVAITSNATANPRIDNIVAYLNPSLPPDADGGGVVTVYAIAGTPAASPVAPATPSYCISLANVAVSAGAASIVTANITDTRTYANLYVPDGNAIYFDPPSDVGTLMYGGTSQTGTPTGGDGWRFTYDQGYNGGTADYLVWEKTDGNQTDPDGGFAWLMTGNDGMQEESLVITGAGNVEVHDGNSFSVNNSADTESITLSMTTNAQIQVTTGNLHVFDTDHDVHVRIYSQAGGATYLDMWHDGTDAQISTGSGDIYFTPNGGDVFFRSGTDIRVYNNANTAYGIISMGTNLDITTSSGDVSISPFGNLNIASIALTHDIKPVSASTYTLGTPSLLWAAVYADQVECGNFTRSLDTMSFSVGVSGGFDFDASTANQYIKIPVIAGSPSSLANGMIWYDSTAGLFKVREGGATRTM